MPVVVNPIVEHFWVILLAFSAFNYWWANGDAASRVPADKLTEAKAYIRTFAVAGALPWVVMGAGQISGATPTGWEYLRPQDGNLFVLAWFALVCALCYTFAGWVFLAGGSKKVVEFNLLTTLMGQRGRKPPSEDMVRVVAALGLLNPIWFYLWWFR